MSNLTRLHGVPHRTWCRSRRDFLFQAARWIWRTGVVLILLTRDGLADTPAANDPHSPLAAKPPPHTATAKSVIFLFMEGGPSHLDLFDPKPKLIKLAGKPLPDSFSNVITAMGESRLAAAGRQRDWKQHGEERPLGFRLAAAFGRVCRRSGRHPLLLGRRHQPLRRRLPDEFRCSSRRPALAGSWVTYGLGTENENLPAFVVMQDNNGQVINGPRNWGSGFMPAVYQGTRLQASARTRSPI